MQTALRAAADAGRSTAGALERCRNMIACEDAVLETWRPDFSSSSQRDPTWTRATCFGAVLCNSLEWPEWLENPVQVCLWEACGHAGCESGGYVHVSRLGSHMLWTR